MNTCKAQITEYLLNEFNNIRTINIKDDTWYAAIDITKQMGYSNNFKAIKDHCDEVGIMKVICSEDGKGHPTLFINEENLCRLVLASKVASTKKMKNQIFKFIYNH